MVTSSKDWKKKSVKFHELQVPTGNVCLVRRLGPDAFAELTGSIPNALLAEVLPLLEEAKEKGKSGDVSSLPPETLDKLQEDILNDPSQLMQMVTMVDAITLKSVVQPKLYPVEDRDALYAREDLTPEERDELLAEMLFIDEVDFEDKMFIFQFSVGGTADLERFREGTQELMGARQDIEEVSDSTE